MTQPLEDEKRPYKRDHIGPKEQFPPSDPGEMIVFLVGTGNTLAEQKEWIAFVNEEIRSAGDRPITEAEIRERWKARKSDPFYAYTRKGLDEME